MVILKGKPKANQQPQTRHKLFFGLTQRISCQDDNSTPYVQRPTKGVGTCPGIDCAAIQLHSGENWIGPVIFAFQAFMCSLEVTCRTNLSEFQLVVYVPSQIEIRSTQMPRSFSVVLAEIAAPKVWLWAIIFWGHVLLFWHCLASFVFCYIFG